MMSRVFQFMDFNSIQMCASTLFWFKFLHLSSGPREIIGHCVFFAYILQGYDFILRRVPDSMWNIPVCAVAAGCGTGYITIELEANKVLEGRRHCKCKAVAVPGSSFTVLSGSNYDVNV